jgi:hypothetical protein
MKFNVSEDFSQFLNTNNSVFNYLKFETNIDLKSLFSPLINPVLNCSIRQSNIIICILNVSYPRY